MSRTFWGREEVDRLERGLLALEGLVLEARSAAFLPPPLSTDSGACTTLDNVTRLLMQVRAELALLRTMARWQGRPGRRDAR